MKILVDAAGRWALGRGWGPARHDPRGMRLTGRVRARLVRRGAVGLVVGGVLSAASLLNLFPVTQVRASDVLFATRPIQHARSTVIVAVDERTYRALLPAHGPMTEWPRDIYARAIAALGEARPRVIAPKTGAWRWRWCGRGTW